MNLLLLEAGGHLWWGWAGNTQSDLNTIIDEPLQGSECTDHNDTRRQTVPHAHEAQLLDDLARGGSLRLVQLGDEHISRMRDDGTEHTGNVTSGKGDNQLLALGAVSAWLGYHIPGGRQSTDLVGGKWKMLMQCNLLVKQLHSTLEASELHHGVWDLTHPQWHQTLVEGSDALLLEHLGNSLTEGVGKAGNGLNLNLGGLERRQSNVGKDLSRSGCSQVNVRTVQISLLLAQKFSVLNLEHFVETELAQTLKSMISRAAKEIPD